MVNGDPRDFSVFGDVFESVKLYCNKCPELGSLLDDFTSLHEALLAAERHCQENPDKH